MEEVKSHNNILHRFYENDFPQVDDCVVVEVTNVEENASYVILLEYNHIQGMIPPNETTQSMQQNMQKALQVGKQEVVKVLRVDSEKGYIDLSKTQVSSTEIAKTLDFFHKSKTVHSIMNNMAKSKVITIEEAYKTIIWPLYKHKDFTHAHDALRAYLDDPLIIDELNLPKEVKTELDKEIRRRMTPQSLKVVANFELKCNEFAGIEAIKQSLRAGQEKSRSNFSILFRILGSPVYEGIIETTDRSTGIEVLQEALKAVEEKMIALQGIYVLRDQIQVYGDKTHDAVEDLVKKDDSSDEDDDDEDEDEQEEPGIEGSDDEEEQSTAAQTSPKKK